MSKFDQQEEEAVGERSWSALDALVKERDALREKRKAHFTEEITNKRERLADLLGLTEEPHGRSMSSVLRRAIAWIEEVQQEDRKREIVERHLVLRETMAALESEMEAAGIQIPE